MSVGRRDVVQGAEAAVRSARGMVGLRTMRQCGDGRGDQAKRER